MPIKLVNVNELDPPQLRVVQHQVLADNLHVTGPPGSGKTVVAVLRVQTLIKSGQYTRPVFLAYNHSVISFIQAMFREMNLYKNLEINNKDMFLISLGNRNGFSFHFGSTNYGREYERLLRHLRSRQLPTTYQVIFLDEVQDFSEDEIEILKQISENMIAVGDYDQQVKSAISDNRKAFSQFNQFHLNTIYLFGTSIARVAEPFANTHSNLEKLVTKTSNVKPFRVSCSNTEEAMENVLQIIRNRNYADSTMGIIAPEKKMLSALSSFLSQNEQEVFWPNNNKNYRNHNFDLKIPVLLTTDSSKGTEFDTVILFGFNEGFALSRQRNEKLFVSLTRTCNELYLLEEPDTIREFKEMKEFISMADATVESDSFTDF